jgi:hypothetical protein
LGKADPTFLAVSRWVDVLLGCVIGIAVAWVMPLRRTTSLAQDAAAYCGAVSQWFCAMAEACEVEAADRGELLPVLADRRRAARATRIAFDSALSTALLELPAPGRESAGGVATVVRAVRAAAEAGVAVATRLDVGAGPSPTAAYLAGQVCAELDSVGRALTQPSAGAGSERISGGTRAGAPGVGVQPPDALAAAMLHALASARRAHAIASDRPSTTAKDRADKTSGASAPTDGNGR